MVTPAVRSFFLNEVSDHFSARRGGRLTYTQLDGIAANHGILTISTSESNSRWHAHKAKSVLANHPERIDDAIVNRPSRFDVKYTYALPDASLRRAFAEKWIAKVAIASGEGDKPKVQFTKSVGEVAERVASATEGFSFAFLKELSVHVLFSPAVDRVIEARV